MTDPSTHRSRAAAAIAGGYAVLGGLVSLCGWLFGVQRLTDWIGTGISMMPNTAIAVLLAGSSVVALAWSQRRLALVGGAGAGLIGGLTLIENVAGVDLGIDRVLLLHEWGQRAVTAPGRMGLPASSCLTVLGAAFVVVATGSRGRRVAALAGVATMAITLLSIIGHLFGASTLAELPNRTAIALQTSTMLFSTGFGLVLLLDDVQPMATLRATTPIATLVRRLLPVFVLLPIGLGLLRLEGERAGLYDTAFGTAARTLFEVLLFCALLWWTAATVGRRERDVLDGRRKLEESEAALRLQTDRLRGFLETAAIALHRVGPDGSVLWANEAELHLLGYTRDEYVGRHIADFHADRAVIDDILRRLHGGERLINHPARMKCRDGSVRDVVIDSSVLWDRGRFVHTQCFTRDVTEQKRLERELRDRMQQLKSDDRRKDEFLATLAHELRNPLAPIRNMLEILKRSGATGDLFTQARVIMQRQLEHMTRLIDDLLDMSRIRTGRIALRQENVELAKVVRNAIETVQCAIEQKGHQLSVVLPPMPIWLHADAVRLAQVFGNLLSNACKYTDGGGAGHLAIEAARSGEHVEVVVKDNGVGIPREMLTKVFDMFAQVERPAGTTPDGLGIGLSLVRKLVEMHGGTVEARSAGLGQGCEIVVRLPILSGVVAPSEKASSGAGEAGGSRTPAGASWERRILVADDNEDAAMSLALLLQLHGHHVETAKDGASALHEIARFRPHIVLLDIGMPKLNGYEVAKRLRASETNKDLVLVAITGWGQEQDRQRARDAGFDAHLVKPIEPDALLELLRRFAASAAPVR